MQTVSLIIVNWNGKDDTAECLASVKKLRIHFGKTQGKQNIDLRTIVVDNGSTDGSVPFIKGKFPDTTVLQADKNLGFSGGNNAGITHALSQGSDFIWLLNNDTIVDKNSLFHLLRQTTEHDAGIVGTKIYFYPGREFHADRYHMEERGKVIWYAGGVIDWDNMYASHRGVDESDHGQYDMTEETQFVSGCSMFITRRVIESVGKLDDRFFVYLEDLDYCLRAKRAGYRLYYVPEAVVWHKNAGSTDRPGHDLHQYYLTRNRFLIGMRYAPFRTKFALFREGARFLFGNSFPKRQAVIDAYTGRFGNRWEWKNT